MTAWWGFLEGGWVFLRRGWTPDKVLTPPSGTYPGASAVEVCLVFLRRGYTPARLLTALPDPADLAGNISLAKPLGKKGGVPVLCKTLQDFHYIQLVPPSPLCYPKNPL